MTTGNQLPPPFFIADHPALDFLNSVCAPWGEDIEWLADGLALIAWMQAAGVLGLEAGGTLVDHHPPASLDRTAVQARRLREQFRQVVETNAGAVFPSEQLSLCEPFNQLLADDRQHLQLVDAGTDGVALRWQREWQTPTQLLMALSQVCMQLVASSQLAQVKQCQGQGCTLWYVDNSKNQQRRWCSMAVCGNRAKAAGYRARTQKE
ncbi:CGNR zinc finger domain-containing protein [Halioxenophilus aromaticivorans]|uniref:ABATE domain-containing protein n=1 Tax=Halioxenophilus aromaticivorans TaxID=1306992 RepID=A0AAV3U039_9ALTE